MTLILIALAVLACVLLAWLYERSRRRTYPVEPGVNEAITLPHEQTWELYHNAFSLCSKKIRVGLAELGVEYRSLPIELIETGRYDNISRDFLAVNPAAVVPVLVHKGHPVYESHEQLAYAAVHAHQPHLLVPKDPEQRERMDYWVNKGALLGDNPIAGRRHTLGNAIPGLTLPLFAAMLENVPISRILPGLLFHRVPARALAFLGMKLNGLMRLPRRTAMAGAIAASREAMHTHLDELEAELAGTGGPWLLGEQFTLADAGMMAALERLREADWETEFLTAQRPEVTGYWARLRARPSYTAAIADFEHPTVVAGRERLVAAKGSSPALRSVLHRQVDAAE